MTCLSKKPKILWLIIIMRKEVTEMHAGGIDVKCMYTKFSGHSFSGFGVKFPFQTMDYRPPRRSDILIFFLNFFNEYHYNHLWYPPTTIIIDCKKALRSKGDQRR